MNLPILAMQMKQAKRRARYVNGAELPPYECHRLRAAVRMSLYEAWQGEDAPMRNGINNRSMRKHRRARA